MSFVYTFVVLAGFWVLLSGKFDAFHLTLGGLSCLLVAWLSHDFLFEPEKKRRRPIMPVRFALYIPWLLYEIFKANLYVASLALRRSAVQAIDPRIIRFRTGLKSDLARVTLANSITLTPGTITVHIVGDEFMVHAIDERAAGDLPGDLPSAMERRVARVFGEDRS